MEKFNNLRVAFLHPRLEGGGAETVSLTTAKLFSQWGIHCTFIGYKHNKKEFILDKDINGEIFLLPDTSAFETETNKIALIQKLSESDIRIAFICYLNGEFFAKGFEGINSRLVYWLHSSPFWEYFYEEEVKILGATYSIRKWIEWYLLGGKNKFYKNNRLSVIQAQYKRDLDIFDRYITLSSEYKKELIMKLSLEESEGKKIVPIINTLEINPEPQLKKKKVIAFVARMSIISKRFDLMLQIWSKVEAQLPDWELRFYGSGPDEWLWHKLKRKYRLNRAVYMGYESDLSLIYNDAAIVCLTSSFEGWGMVLAEAQNNGCIPMVFDSYSAAKEVIGEEGMQAGLLIPAFDIDKYARTLVEICTNEDIRLELQQISLRKRWDYAPNINDAHWHELLNELIYLPIG